MWASGAKLRMRNLLFRQLSSQCALSTSAVYLNDFSAILNDTDFVNANGMLNLRRPYHYSGKISANVANLATIQPLLRASGNQNALAGAIRVDWEGSGNAETFKNSGKLNLV